MINYTKRKDKNGNILIDWEVTQGDTFPIAITLKSCKEIVDPQLITKIQYKQGTEDWLEVYRTDFFYLFDKQKWQMKIPGEVTGEFEPQYKYNYEVEATFVDGSVKTLNIKDLLERSKKYA